MHPARTELGAKRAGLDDQYANPEWGDLGCERFGDGLERELRRAVGAEPGGCELTAHRADLDDRPVSALAHAGQHRLEEPDGADEHRLVPSLELVDVDLLHRADRSIAGIVDEHVDAPEPVDRRPDRRADVLWFCHVETHGDHTVGCFADQAVKGFLLALVAAGVGVTRLPLSARTLRDTGVAFVPLRDESADVVVAWIDDRPRPGVDALRALLQTLARETDLLSAG